MTRPHTVEERCGMPVFVEARTLPELPDRDSQIDDEGLPPGKRLRAGAARVDVTPAGPVALQGYEGHNARPSTEVHDPMYVRALVLDNGDEKMAFISWDKIRINGGVEVVAEIRHLINERTGIPPQNILISVTHTHSSDGDVTAAPAVEATVKAWENAKDARIGVGSKMIYGIGSSRRRPEDGAGFWGSSQPNPDGVTDNECGVIRVEDEKRNIIAVVACYTAHPSVLDHNSMVISGDYAGIGTLEMEKRLGGDAVAMFLQGCAGDVGTHTFRTSRTIPEAERLGEKFAGEVLEILSHIDVSRWVRLAGKNKIIALPRKKSDKPIKLPLLEDGKSIADEIQALLVGETLIISLGSMEAYSEIGLAVKDASPFSHTFTLAYSNGQSLGYLPSPHAYSIVDPDVKTCHFAPEAPHILIEHA
ncbi:MAG: hypothetical protein SVV80_08335, partial [Planctomycetota bacterium]|nr:hypothetical protein [Planctomycetota bacterium]